MLFDIPKLLQKAFDDETLSRRADLFAAEAMMRLASYDFERGVIHASDLGKCKAAVHARIHGLDVIPIPWTTRLKYFKFGALYGALLGAYFKVGLEATRDDIQVVLEPEMHYRGVVGHTDALALKREDKRPLTAVEFKTNMNTSPPKPPHKRNAEYQVYQSGLSALAAPCPDFYVVTFGPAVENRRVNGERTNPVIYDSTIYSTDDWKQYIDEDIDRLQAALGDVCPEPDPPQAWFCESCTYAACTKNKNPDRNLAPKALESA